VALEDDGAAAGDVGHSGDEVGEGDVHGDGDDAGVAADVAENAVAGAGEDLAAEAADELHLLRRRRGPQVLHGPRVLLRGPQMLRRGPQMLRGPELGADVDGSEILMLLLQILFIYAVKKFGDPNGDQTGDPTGEHRNRARVVEAVEIYKMREILYIELFFKMYMRDPIYRVQKETVRK